MDPNPDERRLAEELGAYDEALRKGRALNESKPSGELDESDDLSALQQCLNRLERRFPRRHTEQNEQVDHGEASAGVLEPSPPFIGRQIGRFTIERELGRGGFSVVLLAYDERLKRRVALKLPRLETLGTAQLRERFMREAEAAAGLDHPNIVPIYEVGEVGPVCYIALAYCEGQNLAQWLAERAQPVSDHLAAAVVAVLAEAVQHGHDRGVLHRDIKPGNVMLVPAEEGQQQGNLELPFTPRLTDFGLAKVLDATLAETRSSVVLGTPLYMSPEQAEGRPERIGPAADIHALGTLLYELLTGRPPFEGESLVEVLDQLRTEEPTPPRRLQPSISPELETICLKCLRKDPSQRYASARDVARDLRSFLNGEPIDARPPTWAERLLNWMRRPARIREAGVLMIWLNAIVASWALLNLLLHVSGVLLSGPKLSPGMIRDSVVVIVAHGVAVWLGRGMVRGWRPAIWAGTALSTALLTGALLLATGFGEPFGGNYENDDFRIIVFNVLSVMFAVQLAACVVAAIADRVRHHRL